MSSWKLIFGKKDGESASSPVLSPASATAPDRSAPSSREPAGPGDNRRIRVFISSTFRDMIEERDALMTHTWPELRRLCQERHVELVEVDLRWGIAESQSTRKETLKLCLDEIRACRPFFVGLLGERYGWTPGNDAFTADLKEEQPWLNDLHGKSVTELEILHGVLRNPEMAVRAFFYFRDPAYAQSRASDFLSESAADADKQAALKTLIRTTCATQRIPLRENYAAPRQLAAMVLADLSAAIESQYPKEAVPDALTREAKNHEAFAEIRRRTYIGRDEYFEALDLHAAGEGGPLLVLGDSGSGKSALLANWVAYWREEHPKDFVVQHYIGGTADSADHWRLMTRLMAEIKRWADDPQAVPTEHEDMLRDFPLWLAKAKARAHLHGVRFIVVLDALNQLEDQDHARLLGWLPEHPFTGPLRLVVSALPGKADADDPLEAIQKRGWRELRVGPLTVEERQWLIADYLARFGKKLDDHRLDRLASATPAANPLYLKILLDDLRVTGTYARLDERLGDYLKATSIPALLQKVLSRYQRDYDRDRKGLVAQTLGLIYAARRGLSEAELLQLLRPAGQAKLPPALWAPLRAAMEDSLVDRGGILNFAHDFLRSAVKDMFVSDLDKKSEFQLQLADYFEAQPITERTCDELPWLLKETGSHARLRACLLDMDRFAFISTRDKEELRRYWIEQLHEQQTMGKAYLASFELCLRGSGGQEQLVAAVANELGLFLLDAALYSDAEPIMRHAVRIREHCSEKDDPCLAAAINNLAQLLKTTNRLAEAEPLMRRALEIQKNAYGENHPSVARSLNNLSKLLQATNRLAEAEPLMRRAVETSELCYGKDHPNVARWLSNLADLLQTTNRFAEAEPLYRRALEIMERSFGADHPDVSVVLNNLAVLLQDTNRLGEAEPLKRRVLEIQERSFGEDHPNVAQGLSNLAQLLWATNHLAEAEPLIRRSVRILEHCLGKDHPLVATGLNNLATLLHAANRLSEAEPLFRQAISIWEKSLGQNQPDLANPLNNLALLLQATDRIAEAERLLRRALDIEEQSLGKKHPAVARDLINLAGLLRAGNRPAEAEQLLRRALEISERSFGRDHPDVAATLNMMALLLVATGRGAEAEPLYRRAMAIWENSLGANHPNVARVLGNLAMLLQAAHRLAEAEPLMRRLVEILSKLARTTGHPHLQLQPVAYNYAGLLKEMGRSREEIVTTLRKLAPELFQE